MNRFVAMLCACLLAAPVQAAEGLLTYLSPHSAKATLDRLEAALNEKGMKIFLRVDHAAGAQAVGKVLAPTELLVFGSPQVGTALMKCGGSVGIDLPLKALAWEDEAGTWLAFNDPAYLARRHGLAGCDGPLAKVSGALEGFARAATAP